MKKRAFCFILAVILTLSLISVSASAQPDGGPLAASPNELYAAINEARAAVSKPDLIRSDGLNKLAGIYAGILCDAGAEFRKSTDFLTLPSGEKVTALAPANRVAVTGFSYSVFIGDNIKIESTNEFRQKALEDGFTRVGVAGVNGEDGLYVTVITYDKTPKRTETALSEYTISSGTYANGDAPFDDIPFIRYSISVPGNWMAEKNGTWENEAYYTFHKDSSTNLYAGESYRKDYMDGTSLSVESDLTTLAFGDYSVKLRVIEANEGFYYYFYIPVDNSYCQITGFSTEYSQKQQDEFFDIVKTFEVVE
jgi:hypothetical protein